MPSRSIVLTPIAALSDGWEYVYGNSGIDYEIVIKKDDVVVDTIPGSAPSTKGIQSTLKPNQDKGHSRGFSVKDITYEPKETGRYTAEVTITDSVDRSDTLGIIDFNVADKCEPSFRITPPSQTKYVGETA